MSAETSHVYRIDPLLGVENYSTWKVKMIDILTDLGYEDHIADNTSAASPADLAKWNKADRKALSTIRLRVADGVLVYISSAPTAKEAWSTLATMYESKGPIGIVLARRRFFRAEADATDQNIEPHIRLMRSYQSELKSLGQPVTEEDFSITLLTSLPETWNPFISSSIDENILKDSNKLVSRILAEQQRLNEKAGASTALVTRSSPRKPPYHAQHTPSRQDPPNAFWKQAQCFKCGGTGHISRVCPSPDGPEVTQANVADIYPDGDYSDDEDFAF